MIYFIQETGGASNNIKIGYSQTSAKNRIGALQTGSSSKLVLLYQMEGTIKDENRLHHRFRKHNVHGEWFRPDFEIISFIMAQRQSVTSFLSRVSGGFTFVCPECGDVDSEFIRSEFEIGCISFHCCLCHSHRWSLVDNDEEEEDDDFDEEDDDYDDEDNEEYYFPAESKGMSDQATDWDDEKDELPIKYVDEQ